MSSDMLYCGRRMSGGNACEKPEKLDAGHTEGMVRIYAAQLRGQTERHPAAESISDGEAGI